MVAINQKKLNQFLASDRVSFKGVEKENLRSDKDGRISNKSFPEAFGVHNFNSFVTLDYSQPHLEIVTPTFQDNSELYGFLGGLHAYVEQNLEGDLLWNYSMPPKFKGKFIKLPPYGKSNKTKLAHLYRLGLRNRYGDKMQSTAGIHFNISFSESVIKELNTTKTDLYLGICRNFLRVFPLVLRLIGCSPVAHRSFIKDRELSIDLLKEDENYLPKSTSLRVSRLGYYSEEQDEKFITFNTLGEYLNLIKDYINIPNKKFSEISLDLKKQVNNGTIQMENELYNHIRPKGLFSTKARQYNQLKNDGIEYLEIRSIDLNPFTDIGISKLDLDFLELLITFCALSDSPPIDDEEAIVVKENIRRASEAGQDCSLINSSLEDSGESGIQDLTLQMLENMKDLAKSLGWDASSLDLFDIYLQRNETPLSSQLIEELGNKSLLEFIIKQSQHTNKKIDPGLKSKFDLESNESHKKYLINQKEDNIDFESFLEGFRGEIK